MGGAGPSRLPCGCGPVSGCFQDYLAAFDTQELSLCLECVPRCFSFRRGLNPPHPKCLSWRRRGAVPGEQPGALGSRFLDLEVLWWQPISCFQPGQPILHAGGGGLFFGHGGKCDGGDLDHSTRAGSRSGGAQCGAFPRLPTLSTGFPLTKKSRTCGTRKLVVM